MSTVFRKIDVNGDGMLSREEMERAIRNIGFPYEEVPGPRPRPAARRRTAVKRPKAACPRRPTMQASRAAAARALAVPCCALRMRAGLPGRSQEELDAFIDTRV